MPNCHECSQPLDTDKKNFEVGDVIACENCGAEHEVTSSDPIEIELIEEEK